MHLLRYARLMMPAVATMTASAQFSTSDSTAFREVFRIDGRYVNDHALIRAADRWHLFYTSGSVARRPWFDPGNEIEIGHASSADLVSWRSHPPAIVIDVATLGRTAHVYAPAIVERDGLYTMFFTQNLLGYGSGESIVSAVSRDLESWQRTSTGAVIAPGASWAAYLRVGNQRLPVSCRDPYVLRLAGGGYVMYYVARLRIDSSVHGGLERACVAAATSDDLVHWRDRGPVLTRAVMGDDRNRWAHPESPCVVVKDGRYYLFWKGGDGTRYVISNDPLDFEGTEEHILGTSHASKVFEWDGVWRITSCSRAIGDVLHATTDRTRGLFVADLDWSGLLPKLRLRRGETRRWERAPRGGCPTLACDAGPQGRTIAQRW